MPYVQMTKTLADPQRILLPGKIYEVSDAVAKDLLADNACTIVSKNQLPKTNKGKRRLMPSPIPDPEDPGRHSAPKPPEPEDPGRHSAPKPPEPEGDEDDGEDEDE